MLLAELATRRLLVALMSAWGVVTVTFLISRVLPADPVALLVGPHANEEVVRGLSRSMGLDQPLPVQYMAYVTSVARGDLGTSLRTGQPVVRDLASRLPATLELVLSSAVFGMTAGLVLGVATAVWRGRWLDYLGRGLTLLGLAVPTFWMGLVLLYVLFFQLRWLPPPVGRLPIELMPPPPVTGLLVVDSAASGRLDALSAAIRQLVLPTFTLCLVILAPVSRVLRAGMLEALAADYVRTARAIGLAERRIQLGHALRNALLPTITIAGSLVGNLLGGAVLVETVFSWPGLGRYAVDAIQVSDYAAIQGFVLVSALLYVIALQCVEIVIAVLDPRVREPGAVVQPA